MRTVGPRITNRQRLELHAKTAATVSQQLEIRENMLRNTHNDLKDSDCLAEERLCHIRINLLHNLIELLKLIQSQKDQSRFHELVLQITACASWTYYWSHISGTCKRLGITDAITHNNRTN